MTGAEIYPKVRANSKGGRYSENLMKWLRKHKHEEIVIAFTHHSNLDGSYVEMDSYKTQAHQILIGRGFDEDGWLYGQRLSTILTGQSKGMDYAYPPSFQMELLPNWIEGYIQGGKCFIDPEHRLYHDRERWQESKDGKRRKCVWCGEYEQAKVVKKRVVTDTSWQQLL